NFKYFLKKHPDFNHPSLLTEKETERLFIENGFSMIKKQDISWFPHHSIPRIPIVKDLILKLLNFFEFFKLTKEDGYYWMGVFKRV
ncbi:MAG: hypothetical protein OXB84_08315, partial [Halobacteriovoraceae bacterium]|nr:hypothetical protein [Halobacteriovoraceae bacterium]